MTIEEYKEVILHQLEKADDCEEVEQIIDHAIKLMQDKSSKADLIIHYLSKLHDGLDDLSPTDFDSVHWCNIRCAIIILKKRKNV
jgi:hypothetical protein